MNGLRKLGEGCFTTAYMYKDRVLLKSIDPIKECMAYDLFPNSRLFPKIHFGDNPNEYTMKYYAPVTAPKQQLNAEAYRLYKELRNVTCVSWLGGFRNSVREHVSCRRTQLILLQAYDACHCYSRNVGFEISPRNIAVTPQGHLVLRDCFFCKDLCHRVMTKQVRKPR